MHKYSVNAIKSGFHHPVMARVAEGTALHAHQVLLRMFTTPSAGRLVSKISDHDVCSHMVFPHELLFLLASEFEQEFTRRLGADQQKLQDFWERFSSSTPGAEHMQAHPHLAQHRDLSHTIPLVLHLDAGPYSKKASTKILTFSSLLGVGKDIEQRFLCASWISQAAGSNAAVWDCLRWSLDCLSMGTFPTADHRGAALEPRSWRDVMAGRPLLQTADGQQWSCVWLFWKGDMEMVCRDLRLGDYNSSFICGLCWADRLSRPYNHFTKALKPYKTRVNCARLC